MAETKKGWRPSLTAYRELEEKNRVLNEIVGSIGNFEEIVRDNAFLRQSLVCFHKMITAHKDKAVLMQGSHMSNDLVNMVYKDIKARWDENADTLCVENNAYSKANKLMEEEIKRLHGIIEEAGETIQAMDKEIYVLCHRNLWERILNK